MYTNRKCRPSMDTCKNHSGRSEKDIPRLCPANLSKKELEDVYFSLFDNNMQLKTKLNSQEEQIKILNIKVQRLVHAQRPSGRGERDCCMRNNALINEQKEMISDLKVLKERMAEKIKQLNRQLCSTKQFLKGNGTVTRCHKCRLRNTSTSFVNTKRSETNLKQAVAVLSHGLEKLQATARSAAASVSTETDDLDHKLCLTGMQCENNKCRCEIEELKKRNAELENELLHVHERHLSSESATERQLVLLRQENAQLKHLNADLDQSLRDLTDSLRTVDNDRCELASQLTLEQRKVAELETRVRLSCTSSEITRVLRKHLSQKIEEERTMAKQKRNCCCNAVEGKYKDEYPRTPRASTNGSPEMARFRNSDDSGYADFVKSGQYMSKNLNEESTYSQPPRPSGPINEIDDGSGYLQPHKLSETKNKIDEGHGYPQPRKLSDPKNKIDEGHGYLQPPRLSVTQNKIEEGHGFPQPRRPSEAQNKTEEGHGYPQARRLGEAQNKYEEEVPPRLSVATNEIHELPAYPQASRLTGIKDILDDKLDYLQPLRNIVAKHDSVEESKELIEQINNIQYQIDELKSDAFTEQVYSDNQLSYYVGKKNDESICREKDQLDGSMELKEGSKTMNESEAQKAESSDEDDLQEDSKTVIGKTSRESQNLEDLDEGDKLAELEPQIEPPIEPPIEPSTEPPTDSGNKEETIEAHWALTPQRSLVLDLELDVPRTVRISTYVNPIAIEEHQNANSKADGSSEPEATSKQSSAMSRSDSKESNNQTKAFFVNVASKTQPNKPKHHKGHRARAKSEDINEVARSKPDKELKHRSKNKHYKVTGAEIAPELPKPDDFARKGTRSSEGSKSRSNETERTYVKDKIINDVLTHSGFFPALLRPHASFPPPSKLQSISLQTYSSKRDPRRGSLGSWCRSPDDTDSEISSLSDLPSEKDELVRVRLSLGEERPRLASSSSEPSAECASLSEGELRVRGADSGLSLGEKPNASLFNKQQSTVTSPEKMQQAISAVSKEMLRCRRLIELVSQGEREPGAI